MLFGWGKSRKAKAEAVQAQLEANASAAAIAAPPAIPTPATAEPPAAPVASGAPMKHPFTALGEVTSLLIAAPGFQRLALSELSRLVLPAIRLNQIAIAQGRDDKGTQRPVAAVLWARVSPAVDARLTATPQVAPKLLPEEWNSGSIAWIVAAVGPEKVCEATIAEISRRELGGASLKRYVAGPDGTLAIRAVAAEALASADRAAA
ncbi:MAG: toxin-activating lysine-acyltransferase [Hyphomicrobiaceae bacterium]|nr:toxin-activating lysine-acyltransferase [Hyphomicrobiaceae bacterium]